jgi:hypothetical protein
MPEWQLSATALRPPTNQPDPKHLQADMVSNLFTNRQKKQQAPKVCIAPPVNPVNPLTPLSTRLLCSTTWIWLPGTSSEWTLSQQYQLIESTPALYYSATSPPIPWWFYTQIAIDPDYASFTLTIDVSMPFGVFRIFGPTNVRTKYPYPFDTGPVIIDIPNYYLINRITI